VSYVVTLPICEGPVGSGGMGTLASLATLISCGGSGPRLALPISGGVLVPKPLS
jgi:hypothetical protein